jgi:hypothetical protein
VKIKSNKEQLEQMLKDKNIKVVGEYSFLGYNAPYEIFNRKNEIIVELQ